jgi:hypothetical protein
VLLTTTTASSLIPILFAMLVHHEKPGQASTQADESRCVSQDIVYEDSGNKKKVLYLLCIGLNRNKLPLFSFDDEQPWSRLPKTSVVRPQNSHLVQEVSRRAELYNITPVPRPRSWTCAQSMEWLQQNPVRGGSDVEFLTNEVLRLCIVLERQITGIVPTTGVGGSGRSW